MTRRAYPSDLDDETYQVMLPYLLSPLDAPQRKHAHRDVLDALAYVARSGVQWDFLPHDFPPPEVVRQQAQRWFEAGRGLNFSTGHLWFSRSWPCSKPDRQQKAAQDDKNGMLGL